MAKLVVPANGFRLEGLIDAFVIEVVFVMTALVKLDSESGSKEDAKAVF